MGNQLPASRFLSFFGFLAFCSWTCFGPKNTHEQQAPLKGPKKMARTGTHQNMINLFQGNSGGLLGVRVVFLRCLVAFLKKWKTRFVSWCLMAGNERMTLETIQLVVSLKGIPGFIPTFPTYRTSKSMQIPCLLRWRVIAACVASGRIR